jgi:arginine:pyruvate transaminase
MPSRAAARASTGSRPSSRARRPPGGRSFRATLAESAGTPALSLRLPPGNETRDGGAPDRLYPAIFGVCVSSSGVRPVKLSSFVDRIGGERVAAWDIHYAAAAARARGDDVILLSVGDPDFASPPAAARAAMAALQAGDTHYTELPGRPRLRAAIARIHSERSGQQVGPENVVVSSGAQNGLFAASLCLAESGDEILVPEPMYLTYEATVRASGATLVPVDQPAASGWRLDVEAIRRAVTPRTRAVFFSNPSNPTGVVSTRAELEALARLAVERDLWVVADEVYSTLVYDVPHVSIAGLPGMAERTVTVNSLSKSHAMTGWRVGWTVSPAPLAGHLENLALCMLYGLPGFVMEGAIAALEEAQADAERMRAVYRRRRDVAVERLSQIPGLACAVPEGGMFMLVDVRAFGLSATDFAWGLFRETGVSVLDAEAFGPAAAGHVRLSFVVDEPVMAEACDRIARFTRSLRSGPAPLAHAS